MDVNEAVVLRKIAEDDVTVELDRGPVIVEFADALVQTAHSVVVEGVVTAETLLVVKTDANPEVDVVDFPIASVSVVFKSAVDVVALRLEVELELVVTNVYAVVD